MKKERQLKLEETDKYVIPGNVIRRFESGDKNTIVMHIRAIVDDHAVYVSYSSWSKRWIWNIEEMTKLRWFADNGFLFYIGRSREDFK